MATFDSKRNRQNLGERGVAPSALPGQLVGWVIVSRWKGEPWNLISTSVLTREEAARELQSYRFGSSANREYKRARVVLED
jgi:hypothetical protein